LHTVTQGRKEDKNTVKPRHEGKIMKTFVDNS